MAGRKPSQKEQAYELFDQGFGPSDPEVKEMVPNPGTRYNYPSEWRQDRGLSDYEIEKLHIKHEKPHSLCQDSPRNVPLASPF
jgi:hypothetical protein